MYFLEVHRRGSLSAAARQLGIDQTTVGRRLKALERELGARLLRTTPRGIALTDAGRAILDDVEHVDATVAALRRKVGGRDAQVAGTLRIATTEPLASTFLIPRLGALRERHPELDYVIVAGNRAVDLEAGEADLALRLLEPREPELVARRVGEIELSVFAAPAYLERRGVPERGAQLAGHDVLAYHGDLANGVEARWLADHAERARTVLRVTSVFNLADAASAGLGIAVLPRHLADPGLRELDLAPAPESRGVWIVYHRDARGDARIQAVGDFLAAHVKDPEVFPRDVKASRRGGTRART